MYTSHTFNCGEYHAIRLHRKHQTGADSFTVEKNRTAATNSMLTAYMCPRQVQFMPEEIRKQHTHWHLLFVEMTIHGHRDKALLNKGGFFLFCHQAYPF
jgi:hypothetical protein